MDYKYIVKPTEEKYKKFVKKLRDIYKYDLQAHLDADVNPYYYDKNLQNEKFEECVNHIVDGLGYRGTFEDILVETLGRNNAKKEIRDADGYDSISALYNVIMECITTKEVKATKEDKNKAVSTLQGALRRKLSKKPEPPKKEPSKSYGLLQNTGASMLQAVLRRTLTKKPEPEKKKAGRPKSSKNDMTEEEKRLERNRKARERYVMKKGQK
jgi:hypothetical protein